MKTVDPIFTQYVHGIRLFSCIDVFNWTITYRDDSDIWRPYSGWTQLASPLCIH